MKKIILLRHAKSSWDNIRLKDHDRPLAKRGEEASALVGKFLKEMKLIPDYIICSTAKRAKMTIELVLKVFDKKIKIDYNPLIYEDDTNDIIELISKTDESINTLMIVGHNPGIELLVEKLTHKLFPYTKFSTAGIAVVELNIDKWKKIKKTNGKLALFKSPKKIKKE